MAYFLMNLSSLLPNAATQQGNEIISRNVENPRIVDGCNKTASEQSAPEFIYSKRNAFVSSSFKVYELFVFRCVPTQDRMCDWKTWMAERCSSIGVLFAKSLVAFSAFECVIFSVGPGLIFFLRTGTVGSFPHARKPVKRHRSNDNGTCVAGYWQDGQMKFPYLFVRIY